MQGAYTTILAVTGRPADFSILVPRLATERLLLREPRQTDFERFAANSADPLARVHIGGPMDRREAWRRFSAMAGNWVLQGMGWWAVEEPQAGAVGYVGVFRRETGPELEIGWSVDRPYWGKGYAPEAARAALQFALATQDDHRVIAYIGTKNPQSVVVATKIGMRCEGETEFYGDKHLLYSATR
jgi:RimJ/RimL family protein N-acetyltransferase